MFCWFNSIVVGQKVGRQAAGRCIFPTDPANFRQKSDDTFANFRQKKITDAKSCNYTPIFPKWWLLAPRFAFLDQNYPDKKKIVPQIFDSQKSTRGVKSTALRVSPLQRRHFIAPMESAPVGQLHKSNSLATDALSGWLPTRPAWWNGSRG